MSDFVEIARGALRNGRLAPEMVRDLSAGRSIDEVMLDLIPLASEFASPVLSEFPVGAVGQGSSGALYLGANYEIPLCPLNQTVHAEQATVVNAGSHGEKELRVLAVSAPPCGGCRQFLYELATAADLDIVLAGRPIKKLTEYLPGAFGPEDLDVPSGLLASVPVPLREPFELGEVEGVGEAFEAACRSYAPYTKSYGGVALVMKNGNVCAASYLENAAFNPSVSPMQSSLVVAQWAGHSIEEVEGIVVVQTRETKVNHAAAARIVIEGLGSDADVRVVAVDVT